jgi:hypothetical protein
MKTLLLAAMPLVLMDSTASSPEIDQWLRAEPLLRSALECSSGLDMTDERLRSFNQHADGSWEITPARDFSIVGLPISMITLSVDATGERHSSYTAVIEKRSQQQVEQAVSLLQQQGPQAGRISTAEFGPQGSIALTCTISTE